MGMAGGGGGGMSQGTILSIFALLQVLGTLLFAWLGVYGEKDFFLLLGNLVCLLGCGVWVVMLLEENGNPTWITVYVVLGCVSVYAIAALFHKYRREGVEEDDSESEGEEDETQALTKTSDAKGRKKSDTPPPAPAGVRRRKK